MLVLLAKGNNEGHRAHCSNNELKSPHWCDNELQQ